MEPLDFDIEVSTADGDTYGVQVRSPAGEVRVSSKFPFDHLALENRLQAVQIAILTGGRGGQRADVSPDGRTVQDFAAALFEFLFAGEVRSCYEVSRDKANERGTSLRIRLRCQAPELASLPWEFLFDARRSAYLSLSRHTPVVRYLDITEPITPLRVAPPLQILGVIASPDDLPPLDVDRERDRLERSLATLRRDGLIELTWLEEPTWRKLQQTLRRDKWHIFHFSGHGGFDRNKKSGRLAFVDENASADRTTSARWLSAEELGALLGDADSLRLAVLNACEGATADAQDVFSSTAGALIRRGTPGVVAMQYAISDRAAIELSRTFYESLAEGLAVDAALAEARKAVYMEISGTLEWATPVLYMRTPDGVLFDLDVERAPVATPVLTEAPPLLEVSETVIDAGEVRVGEPVPPVQVSVRNRGGGTLDWLVDSTADWLELERDETSFTVTMRPTEGVNHAEIVVFDRPSAARKVVEVNVRVTQPPPCLELSDDVINFGSVTVGEVASRAVAVKNTGGGVLEVVVEHTDEQLHAEYAEGTLRVGVNTSEPGTIAGEIELGGSGGSRRLQVRALVTPVPLPAPRVPPAAPAVPPPARRVPAPEPPAPQPRVPGPSERAPEPRHRWRRRIVLMIGIPVAIVLALAIIALVASLGEKGDVHEVNIPGTAAAVDTGIDLRGGEQVIITATGTIGDTARFPDRRFGPDGVRQDGTHSGDPRLEFPHAALIGQIDQRGQVFLVGRRVRIDSAPAGKLFLGVNDNPVNDNDGSFAVRIDVRGS